MFKRIAFAAGLIAAVVLVAQAAPPTHLSPPTATEPVLGATTVGDSVRAVARWSPSCDVRGCADSSRIAWQVGNKLVAVRQTRRTTDTLWTPAPNWGDSLVLAVSVAPIRRQLTGTVRSASLIVRPSDGLPPAVDSLRIDTIADIAALAERDSFPVIATLDTDGNAAGKVLIGEELQLCAVARNRYTGDVMIMAPWEISDAEAARIERTCERARQAYASRRSG